MNHPNKPSNETPDEFELFWKQYPIKVGKAAAKKAWLKAIKAESPDVIIQGALRYANDPNRHPSFTAHASTWLNAERWGDQPLPPRIVTLEEKRAQELESSRIKSEKERLESERYFAERAEAEAKAVPMPEELKQTLLRSFRK